MKVFVDNIINDFAISRIERALKKYAPDSIQFVNNEDEADLVVIYAFGQRRKIWWRVCDLIKKNKKYAIVQIAIRSTTNPKTSDWLNIWRNAKLVWSYYNLQDLFIEDREDWLKEAKIIPYSFNFYYAPLGVDPEVFKETKQKKRYIITVGNNRNECLKEVVDAVIEPYKDNIFILGGGIDDKLLADVYSKSQFVSGLRRIEGFELPVIEGLLCGARPIVFDKPHYREWFDGLAIFIKEEKREKVTKSLMEIFKDVKNMEPVSEEQKQLVRERFNWETIIKGFWERI